MKWKGKDIRVITAGDADEEYKRLNKIVGEERKNGIKGSKYQTLLAAVKEKVEFLKDNPEYGTHIAKKKIPKYYAKHYDANNLWKCNLTGAWRMIYTIKGSEVEILAIILDIISHKDYEKRFKYKKS